MRLVYILSDTAQNRGEQNDKIQTDLPCQTSLSLSFLKGDGLHNHIGNMYFS